MEFSGWDALGNGTNLTPEEPYPVPTSAHEGLLQECRCDTILYDLVLPPYFLMPISVLVLTGLSILVNTIELRLRYGFSKEKTRVMTGTATITALANPPWWFLAPQVIYHVVHLVFIFYTTVRDYGDTASGWDLYTLSYAKWINGGATVFLVFGMLGGEYTRLIIVGQRTAAQAAADPRGDLENEADLQIFRKNFLNATSLTEMEDMRANYESKAQFMGDEDQWDKGIKTKRYSTLVIVTCLLPALVTHVVPGMLCYAWLTGTACIALHFLCKRYIIPRQQCMGLLPRIVLLDALLAVFAVVLQDSFNFSLLLYQGENYIRLVPDTFMHHRTYCFFCSIINDVGGALHMISLA
eukprot:TRINITY_DN21296_c3_g1_i1.p1 TRINITY_DN21296_c3_g1~~TRINITY_DN21296_c3_g1_i1.p1  ORF type:complete len:353 (+),score=108.31 TRINITY_DN21296_c3_g1_i1:247-1305(+)